MRATTTKRVITCVSALALAGMAGCGGDDDDAGSGAADDAAATVASAAQAAPAASATQTDPADQTAPAAETAPAAPSGGSGGGELVFGDETIAFESARCFLEEQDAAAGGGKILFVAQGFGVNAAGDEVSIDVSRYDEDSQFSGDSISLVIGDPFSPDSASWDASADTGTVTVEGSTVSATGLTFSNFEDETALAGSFRIDC